MNPENEIDKTEALEPVETAAANVAEARGGVDGRTAAEVAAAPDRRRLRGRAGRGGSRRLEHVPWREARGSEGGVRHRRRRRAQPGQRV